jgi:hypothetical protein
MADFEAASPLHIPLLLHHIHLLCAALFAGLLQLAFTIVTGAFAVLTYYSYWLGLAWQVCVLVCEQCHTAKQDAQEWVVWGEVGWGRGVTDIQGAKSRRAGPAVSHGIKPSLTRVVR